jgi:GNAT superfamily N-acetyltransferase
MGMLIRPLLPADRSAVREALCACEAFSEEEVAAALDLFNDPEFPHFGAAIDDVIRGYVCIVVAQRRGIGRALEEHAVRFAREHGGERVVIETSGRADYQGTRAFYEQAGYQQAGRIPDYYKSGDDCVYYYKRIA